MSNSQPFESDAQISSLVQTFESCEIHPAEFRHHQHLAVALWYLLHLPADDACEKMRKGIQRLAASYGKTGYHETITMFWLKIVQGFLATERADSLVELANRLIEKYAKKNLILDYYSAEALASPKAKAEWVKPDLRSFDVES